MQAMTFPQYRGRLAALGMLALLAACGGGDAPVELPLRRLEGLGSTTWPAGNYVVRSETEWRALWDQQLQPVPDPSAARPAVDFTQDALIGVAAGWGSCETFGIVRISRRGDDLQVDWHKVAPAPNVGCGGVLSPKRDFVLVPASIRGRVDFVQVN
jgi:hypothetical protein